MRPSRIVMTRPAHAAMSCSCVTMAMVMPRLAVERLQEREHLEARPGVEVAGRLVGQEERRVGDQGPGDRDALLLAAGELVGRVVDPVVEADRARARPGALAPSSRGRSRGTEGAARTFSSAVVRGSRLNPWKMKPMSRLRTMARASLLRVAHVDARERCRCRASGDRGSRGCSSWSTCPTRSCPTMATNSPAADRQVDVAQRVHDAGAR